MQERNALKRSKPQSDAPHPETPGVKGARADLTRASTAGQIRCGQLTYRHCSRKCAGPKPLPHSLAPSRLKKHGCARSKKHAQKQQSCEFSMHMHENCSKRCAHVACLLSTRRGHSSHAMLGKASASATLTVRRRPSRQPEASARAPSGPNAKRATPANTCRNCSSAKKAPPHRCPTGPRSANAIPRKPLDNATASETLGSKADTQPRTAPPGSVSCEVAVAPSPPAPKRWGGDTGCPRSQAAASSP